jgi:serine/threonine protein kinase
MKVFRALCYEPIQEIGVGQGMNSTVWRARDLNGGRTIAVKEIDRKMVHGGGWEAYYQEAQAMYASRCDHVVPILYACMAEDRICLAMPYFAAGSLGDRIAAGPAPLAEAYRIADGVLAALSQVHVAGVLHFDLKPSNVLFSELGEPLVADFGQARLMDPSGLSPLPTMYPWGVPPELFGSGIGSVETDVYHAGLTLYRMFNGDPFFEAQVARLRRPLDQAVQSGRFPDRDAFLPHIPDGIRRVIRRALKVAPTERYHSARELQDALGRVRVRLNWKPIPRPDGGYVWRCERTGRTGLEVRLERDADNALWTVQLYSCSNETRRRRGVSVFWASDLSEDEAERHLRKVFSALESA